VHKPAQNPQPPPQRWRLPRVEGLKLNFAELSHEQKLLFVGGDGAANIT
jgi:hypothetical protein